MTEKNPDSWNATQRQTKHIVFLKQETEQTKNRNYHKMKFK